MTGRRLTESVVERDIPNHVECIALKPMSKVQGLLCLSEFNQSIIEHLSTLVYEWFIVDQGAH